MVKHRIPVTWRAYLGAFSVLGFGFVGSVMSSDWQWFSRSGSIVVVIGILLTSQQLLENMSRLRNRRDTKQVKPAMHDWAKGDPRYDITRNHEEETWAAESSGFFLLIIGTLVWGLGDLLGLVF